MLKSIKSKILLCLLAGAFVAITSGALLAIVHIRRTLNERTATSFMHIAQELYYNINHVIFRGYEDIQILASDPDIGSVDMSLEQKKNALFEFKKVLRIYDDITLVNPEGVVLASTDYSYRGSWKYKKHFQKALEGHISRSTVQMIPDPPRLITGFAAPVYSKGEIIAIVTVQYDMEHAGDIIKHVQIGHTGYAQLIDEQNRIIAHPLDEKLLRMPEQSLLQELTKLQSSDINGGSIHFKNDDGTVIGGYFGASGFVAEGGIPDFQTDSRNAKWKVIVAQSEKEVFGVLDIIKIKIVLSAAVLFLILILVGLNLANRITVSLRSLSNGAVQIAAGRLDHRVDIQSDDEIGQLAGTFNQMVEELNKTTVSRDALVKEVAERKKTEEKYRILFEGATDAVFVADPQTGIVLDCNHEATKLIEKDKSQIIGHSHTKIHPKQENPEEFYKTFKEHLKNPNQILETQVVTNTGNIKEVSIKTHMLEIDGKKVIQGMFRDITENKKRQDELQKLHEELVSVSRRAGMAEVATDVLHNVGNVLNSINVSASLITDKLNKSEAENLKKVTDMIIEHSEDLGSFLTQDQQGRHIPVYLAGAAKLIHCDQQKIIEHLQSLRKNINYIKEIVSSQQSYARTGGVQILTDISEVINDVVEINKEELTRHKIQLSLELPELPEIMIDRQRLLQILVNLIANSKDAMSENDTQSNLLTIYCHKQEDRLYIEVIDNGVGIPEENLVKIFQYGFTTKKDGHGFGLHSGALTAKELGGSLSVHSDGIGQGATFILELPFNVRETTECTV